VIGSLSHDVHVAIGCQYAREYTSYCPRHAALALQNSSAYRDNMHSI